MSLKTYKEIRPILGLRNLRRPVVPATVRPAGRRKIQRLNFHQKVCDGPSCHFVTKFRESIFSTQFQIF